MNESKITILHTDLEESKLLAVSGVDPSTADMMWEVISGQPPKLHHHVSLGHIKTYPTHYIPCWSEGKIRTMLEVMKVRNLDGSNIFPIERLVPTLLAAVTMKEQQNKKQLFLHKA